MVEKSTYEKILAEITAARVKEAHDLIKFFIDRMSDGGMDVLQVSNGVKGVFVGALLIEYGRTLANTERTHEKGNGLASAPTPARPCR